MKYHCLHAPLVPLVHGRRLRRAEKPSKKNRNTILNKMLINNVYKYLNFKERFIAIGQHIFCLTWIDSYQSQQQMAGGSQREFHLKLINIFEAINIIAQDLWLKNFVNGILHVGFEYLRLGEFAFPVRGQPNLGKRSFLRKHKLCVKHRALRIGPARASF